MPTQERRNLFAIAYQHIWPGLGLFGESYLLFSIGTLKPLWQELFPDCFDDNYQENDNNNDKNGQDAVCSDRFLTFSVILGIIIGMILIGHFATILGRRRCSIFTATVMSVSSIGLLLVTFIDDNVLVFRSMSVVFFCFGIGVGGEYPLSASLTCEKVIASAKQRRIQQGKDIGNDTSAESDSSLTLACQVQLVFSMQGFGIFCNCLLQTLLLVITGQYGDVQRQYDQEKLMLVWRIIYAIGVLVLLYVWYSRVRYLSESTVWQQEQEHLQQQQRLNDENTNKNNTSIDCLPEHDDCDNHNTDLRQQQQYSAPSPLSPTLSSVSSLSAPSVVLPITNHSMAEDSDYNNNRNNLDDDGIIISTIHVHEPEDPNQSRHPLMLLARYYGVRLLGTSLAWLLWDIAFYGNKLFQSTFLLALTGPETSLLQFSISATVNSSVALMGYIGAAILFNHPNLIGRLQLQMWGFFATGSLFITCGFLYNQLSTPILVSLYIASSFIGQLGPNATTFLIPAEVFPTQLRTWCHGVSAAAGKIGALTATIAFGSMNKEIDLFLLAGYASFAAFAVTYWAIPDTTNFDVTELDKKWRLIVAGRVQDYKGSANQPRYMSYHERNKLNRAVDNDHCFYDMDQM